MEKALQPVKDFMRADGSRITPVKSAILEILHSSCAPISAMQIIKLLQERGFLPHKTTIYRQLATLLKLGLVESVNLDSGTQMFEIKKHHHHHFVCEECNDVIDVDSSEVESALQKLEKQLSSQNIFVKKHDFALFGLCTNCN